MTIEAKNPACEHVRNTRIQVLGEDGDAMCIKCRQLFWQTPADKCKNLQCQEGRIKVYNNVGKFFGTKPCPDCQPEPAEFVKELYEQEPNLKTEGLKNFDGYFVHWNEIIDVCQAAGQDDWGESPIELIINIIDERDEALSIITTQHDRIKSLEAEKGMADMGFVSEGAGKEIGRLQACNEAQQILIGGHKAVKAILQARIAEAEGEIERLRSVVTRLAEQALKGK